MANYITARGVQYFSITIASGNTTGTATINSVGAGAFIIWDGLNPSVSNNPAEDFAYLTLTNATTVTATRNTGTAGTVVINGCVVDGDLGNLIHSVQFGTISVANSSATGTATINPVVNNNAVVHHLGWASANTTLSNINEYTRLSLSGTTVTATRPGTSGALTVGFVVIEFVPTCLNQSVQNVAATSSSSVTSYTSSAFNAVVQNNAILIYGGETVGTATTNPAQFKMRGALSSTTQVTVSINTATTDAKQYNCSVVEFKAGVLNSAVQRSTTTLTGATSGTTTITTINEAYALLNYLGNTATATTAVVNQFEGAATLTTASGSGASIRQSVSVVATGSGTLTSTLAGSLIVVAAYVGGIITSTITVTDNKGQTYTHLTSADAYSGNSSTTQVWYLQNTVSGVTSVTITLGTASNCFASVYEVQNIPTTGTIVDQVAKLATQVSASSGTTPSITTTGANDFIVAVCCTNSVTSVNAPFAFGPNSFDSDAHYIPSGTTTVAATFNFGSAAVWSACIVSFLSNASVTSDVVQVTKNTSTSNITASWEVAEFPAYNQGALVGVCGVQAKIKASPSGKVSLSGTTSAKTFSNGVVSNFIFLKALSSIKVMAKAVNVNYMFFSALASVKMKAKASFSSLALPLSGQTSVKVFNKAGSTFTAVLAAKTIVQIKQLLSTPIMPLALKGTSKIASFLKATPGGSLALSGRVATQIKTKSAYSALLIFKAMSAIIVTGSASITTTIASVYSGIIKVQVVGKAVLTLTANLSSKSAIQIKASAQPKGSVNLLGKINAQIKASAQSKMPLALAALSAIQAKAQASVNLPLKFAAICVAQVKARSTILPTLPLKGRATTQANGSAQPRGALSLAGRTAVSAKSSAQASFNAALSGVSAIMARASSAVNLPLSLLGRTAIALFAKVGERNATAPGTCYSSIEVLFTVDSNMQPAFSILDSQQIVYTVTSEEFPL